MKFKTLKGKEINLNLSGYLVDWDEKERSIIQFKVKKFLQKYWKSHVVCSELRVAGTRMTIDLINISRRIAIEVQGKQHSNYIPFFCKNRLGYAAQMGRDLDKQKFCDINNILLVEIHEHEIDDISEKWFLEKYDITL